LDRVLLILSVLPNWRKLEARSPAAPAREGIIPDIITSWFIPAILPGRAGRAMVFNGRF
jgi:hypothetical protein